MREDKLLYGGLGWFQWAAVEWSGGGLWVFCGQGLEPVPARVKREGDWGNVLNTCNVMESCQCLSVPWRVGGRRRVYRLQRVIVHWERRVCRKENRLVKEFLAITFHFQVMKTVCWTKITQYSCFLLLRSIPGRNKQKIHPLDIL